MPPTIAKSVTIAESHPEFHDVSDLQNKFSSITHNGAKRIHDALPYLIKRGINPFVAEHLEFGLTPYTIRIKDDNKVIGEVQTRAYVLPNFVGWEKNRWYNAVQFRYDTEYTRQVLSDLIALESPLIPKLQNLIGIDSPDLNELLDFVVGHRFTSTPGSELRVWGRNQLIDGDTGKYKAYSYGIGCEGPIPMAVGLSHGWRSFGIPMTKKIDFSIPFGKFGVFFTAFDENQAGYDRHEMIKRQLEPHGVKVVKIPFSNPKIQYDDAVLNGEVENFVAGHYGFKPLPSEQLLRGIF